MKRYVVGNDRELRRTLRNTKKYKSRRELQNDYKVRNTVNRWRRKGFGEAEPEFVEDKYYVPEAFPPRDVATEMGSYGELSKNKLVKLGLVVIAGYIFYRLITP